MQANSIRIDIISDIMCPWCYVGKRYLEQALDALDENIKVDVHWQPYQLDPTIAVTGRDRQQYLSEKFGSPEEIRQVYDPVKAAGDKVGIRFNFDDIALSPNTLDCHRILHWADTYGKQQEMSERFFRAYFIEAADLTNSDILLDLAQSVGLERPVIARLLAGDTDKQHIRQQISYFQHLGVRSVPTMLIDNKYAITGARPPETIREVIEAVFSDNAKDGP